MLPKITGFILFQVKCIIVGAHIENLQWKKVQRNHVYTSNNSKMSKGYVVTLCFKLWFFRYTFKKCKKHAKSITKVM